MIVFFFWGLIATLINAAIALVGKTLGGPPSWWPTGGYDSFVNGMTYLAYFFNIPACIVIVSGSLAVEGLLLTVRWGWRGISLFTGGGGAR